MKAAFILSASLLFTASAGAAAPRATVSKRTPISTRFAAAQITEKHFIGVMGEGGVSHVLRPDGHVSDIYVTRSPEGPRVVIRAQSRVAEPGKAPEMLTLVGAPNEPMRVLGEVQNDHIGSLLKIPDGYYTQTSSVSHMDPLVSGASNQGRDNLVRLRQSKDVKSMFGMMLDRFESVRIKGGKLVAKTTDGEVLTATGISAYHGAPKLTASSPVFQRPVEVAPLVKHVEYTVDVSRYTPKVRAAVLAAARTITARALDQKYPLKIEETTITIPNPNGAGDLGTKSGISVSLGQGEVILLSSTDGHTLWSGSLLKRQSNGGCGG